MRDVETIQTALQALGHVAAFGAIAWAIKRVFTHILPRLAQDFRDSSRVQVELQRELEWRMEWALKGEG